MFAVIKRHCLGGASAVAIAAALTIGTIDPASASCQAVYDGGGGGTGPSVSTSCDGVDDGVPSGTNAAFATSFDSTVSGSEPPVPFIYDGSGGDTLVFTGGSIVQGNGITGDTAPFSPPVSDGEDEAVFFDDFLDERVDVIETLGGDDVIVIAAPAATPPGITPPTIGTAAGNIDIFLGSGIDRFTMSAGTVFGSVFGQGGSEAPGSVVGNTFIISGGTIDGMIFAGSQNDSVTISDAANIVGRGAAPDAIGLEDGDDNFLMTGGSVGAAVSGGNGIDRLRVEGGTIAGFLAGNQGNDVITILGGVIAGGVQGNEGADQIGMSGGSTGVLTGDEGDDTITIEGTAQLQSVLGAAGADRVVINGGTMNLVQTDNADGTGAGADRVTMNGGTVVAGPGGAGNIETGAGGDTANLGGGILGGVLLTGDGDDTVTVFGAMQIRDDGASGQSVGLGAGNDSFSMSGGTVATSVAGGAGTDGIAVSGGTIGGGADSTTGVGISGESGNDTITLTGGSVAASGGGDGDDLLELSGTGRVRALSGDGGADTIRILGGVVVAQVDGDTDDGDESNDGGDTIVMTGGSVGAGLAGYGGNDRLELRGGTVAANADAGSGDDTVILAGTGIGGALALGAGADGLTMSSGSVAGAITGAAGNDSITMGGGQAAGGMDGGDGSDAISISGGTADGGVAGGAGDDTLSASGGTVNGGLNGGTGDDGIGVSGGASVNGGANGGDGSDSVAVSGGSVNGGVNGDAGADSLTLSGGTVNQGVNGGAGDDTMEVSGGTANGGVSGGAGADAVTVSGGTVNQNVSGGDGTDRVEVRGGAIGGNIDAETVQLFGGSIAGDITGLSPNTLVINDAAAPAALILRDGVLFSGADAVGTVTDTDLAAGGRSQNFSGFSSLSASNSTLRFEGGTQTIDALVLANGSTLFIDGVTTLGAQDGGFGNLSATSSMISLIDGDPTDRLSLGGIVLNGATIGIDVNQTEGLADLLVANGPASATGSNILLVNLIGTPELGGTTDIAFLTAGTPVGGTFTVEGIPGTAAALFDYEVVAGPGGGLVLRATPVASLVALLSNVDAAAAAATLETSVRALEGINDDAIEHALGLAGGGGAPNDSLFGVFASGQFARVEHDGFDISDGLTTFQGTSFDSEDFSAAISVDFNAAKYWGFDAEYGLNLGVFAGYASTDLALDGVGGFASLGSAENESGMGGVYALMRRQQNYLLVSATGFWGETSSTSGLLDGAQGEYATEGYAVTASAGHIFALGEKMRFDLRGGLLGATFTGDAYTDSRGVRHGESEISFGALKFEPGIYAEYALDNGMVLSPYARADLQMRFGYENSASAEGRTFEFDDDDFSAALSSGFNLRMNKSTTVSGEVRGKASSDSTTIAAKLGLKVAF